MKMVKLPTDEIEAKLTMRAGSLKQDLILAQDIVKDSGLDISSPVAGVVVNFVLLEIRKIRTELELTLFGGGSLLDMFLSATEKK